MSDRFEPRRSERTHKAPLKLEQIIGASKVQVSEGYHAFSATEHEHDDGKQDCAATVHYRLKNGATGSVAGSTGQGLGHGEMAALYWFLVDTCKGSHQDFKDATLEVECLAKSCCMRCSAILGLLGVSARGRTYKAPKHMGGTQWGIHDDLADAVAASTGVDARILKAFGTLSTSQIGL